MLFDVNRLLLPCFDCYKDYCVFVVGIDHSAPVVEMSIRKFGSNFTVSMKLEFIVEKSKLFFIFNCIVHIWIEDGHLQNQLLEGLQLCYSFDGLIHML